MRLNQEDRKRIEINDIVLKPGESCTQTLSFEKFVDDGDSSVALNFNVIRVMEKYSGIEEIPEEIIEQELNNAIAKFGMGVSVVEK